MVSDLARQNWQSYTILAPTLATVRHMRQHVRGIMLVGTVGIVEFGSGVEVAGKSGNPILFSVDSGADLSEW